MSELSALLTGQTPFTQAAAAGPAIQPGGVAGPAPVNLAALAQTQANDQAMRYQAEGQRGSDWRSVIGQIGGSFLSGGLGG